MSGTVIQWDWRRLFHLQVTGHKQAVSVRQSIWLLQIFHSDFYLSRELIFRMVLIATTEKELKA